MVYLPSGQTEEMDEDDDYDVHVRQFADQDRLSMLQVFLAATRKVIDPLGKVTIKGFFCANRDGIEYRGHSVLASYLIDIPEEKDLLGVRYGQTTENPCIKCTINKTQLGSFQIASLRTLTATMSELSTYDTFMRKSKHSKFIEYVRKYKRSANEILWKIHFPS